MARWVIFPVILVAPLAQHAADVSQFMIIGRMLLAFVLGYGTNYVIAKINGIKRPVHNHPGVKQLFQPWSTDKSFPSDHAMIAAMISALLPLTDMNAFLLPYKAAYLSVMALMIPSGCLRSSAPGISVISWSAIL